MHRVLYLVLRERRESWKNYNKFSYCILLKMRFGYRSGYLVLDLTIMSDFRVSDLEAPKAVYEVLTHPNSEYVDFYDIVRAYVASWDRPWIWVFEPRKKVSLRTGKIYRPSEILGSTVHPKSRLNKIVEVAPYNCPYVPGWLSDEFFKAVAECGNTKSELRNRPKGGGMIIDFAIGDFCRSYKTKVLDKMPKPVDIMNPRDSRLNVIKSSEVTEKKSGRRSLSGSEIGIVLTYDLFGSGGLGIGVRVTSDDEPVAFYCFIIGLIIMIFLEGGPGPKGGGGG